ncbi:hypothetical protein HYW44_05380 [Candidatus Daviesbacteria bacterium]|nr:hypothetical protein [Candidatus Daviesbacteria bacterium]
MKLLFVYNADSSAFAKLKDVIHKTVSPATYQCNLCGLTYGTVSMKNEWKEFISKLNFKSDFLHKDEFKKSYPQLRDIQLPAVFTLTDNNPKQIITAGEIKRQRTLGDLENLVLQKINSF